ncbi:MAG: hypothetical protein WAP37_08205, partial [Solirubrobacterales bacterium]
MRKPASRKIATASGRVIRRLGRVDAAKALTAAAAVVSGAVAVFVLELPRVSPAMAVLATALPVIAVAWRAPLLRGARRLASLRRPLAERAVALAALAWRASLPIALLAACVLAAVAPYELPRASPAMVVLATALPVIAVAWR